MTKDDVKRIYLFPEGLQLSLEQREDLAASLLATIPHYTISRYLDKRNTYILHRNVREKINRKIRRYLNWRKRQK
jgi:hypothetical protein